MKTTTTRPSDDGLYEAAAVLAQSIKSSAEWREWVDAQKAGEADERFARMAARQHALARIQQSGRGDGQGLDGKSLVELIALGEQLRGHELYLRQQQAGNAVVRLLQRINESISVDLGLDFASSAAPRRGGCCG